MRVRTAYARGSDVFSQLGVGLHAQRQPARSPRIAVVMPWVVEASPSSTCKAYQAKPEMKAGARCEAFFTLPVSWPYWLASAGRNAALADFLIFREPGLPADFFRGPDARLTLPSNVKVIEVGNLTELYRAKLGMARVTLNPDKVKDFKPTIGQVFEDYLKAYSHWAFGDVDVVYGDLGRFLTPAVLAHEIITFRTDDMCASMTKTVFAGQLTIFANNDWGRTLYRDAAKWRSVANSEKYMFFDERAMPVHALTVGASRVAMVINQLSDRLFTRNLDGPMRSMTFKVGLRGVRRHMVWRGDDGRLLLVDRRPSDGQQVKAARSWCAVSEAALVHLQQHKFKHFGGMPAFDPAGFVFDRDRGIRPASSLNASGDAHDAAIGALLGRPLQETGLGDGCAARKVESIMERSMIT